MQNLLHYCQWDSTKERSVVQSSFFSNLSSVAERLEIRVLAQILYIETSAFIWQVFGLVGAIGGSITVNYAITEQEIATQWSCSENLKLIGSLPRLFSLTAEISFSWKRICSWQKIISLQKWSRRKFAQQGWPRLLRLRFYFSEVNITEGSTSYI